MKTLLVIFALLTLSLTAFGQMITCDACLTDSAPVYPSRVNNYCLSDLAVASASSTLIGYPAASAIDGDRVGQNCNLIANQQPCWGNSGGWNDSTRGVFPDWLRVDFFRAHSIGRIVVTTFQDNFSTPRIEPYLGLQVGNNYTIDDFTIEVLNASGQWVQVANVAGNIDIIREFVFTPVLGTAIRVTVSDSYVNYSRIIEFEAYSS
jgi:hypothetical protein